MASSTAVDVQRQRIDVLLAAAAVQDANDHMAQSKALLSSMQAPPQQQQPQRHVLQQPVSASAFKQHSASTEPHASSAILRSGSSGSAGQHLADSAGVCDTPRVPPAPHTTGAVFNVAEHTKQHSATPKAASGPSFNSWSLGGNIGTAQQPNTLAFSSPGGVAWPNSPAYMELASLLGSPPTVGMPTTLHKFNCMASGGSGGKSRFAMEAAQLAGQEPAGAPEASEPALMSGSAATDGPCDDPVIDAAAPAMTGGKGVQRRLEMDALAPPPPQGTPLPRADTPMQQQQQLHDNNTNSPALVEGPRTAQAMAQIEMLYNRIGNNPHANPAPIQLHGALPAPLFRPDLPAPTAAATAAAGHTLAGSGASAAAQAAMPAAASMPAAKSSPFALAAYRPPTGTGLAPPTQPQPQPQLPKVANIWPVIPMGPAAAGPAMAGTGSQQQAPPQSTLQPGATIGGLLPVGPLNLGPPQQLTGPLPQGTMQPAPAPPRIPPAPLRLTGSNGATTAQLPVVPLIFSPRSTDGGSSLGKRTWPEEGLMSSCLDGLTLADNSPAVAKYARVAYETHGPTSGALMDAGSTGARMHGLPTAAHAGATEALPMHTDMSDLAPPPPPISGGASGLATEYAPADVPSSNGSVTRKGGRVTKARGRKGGKPPPVPGRAIVPAPATTDAIVTNEAAKAASVSAAASQGSLSSAAPHLAPPPPAAAAAQLSTGRPTRSNSRATTETASMLRPTSDGGASADSPPALDVAPVAPVAGNGGRGKGKMARALSQPARSGSQGARSSSQRAASKKKAVVASETESDKEEDGEHPSSRKAHHPQVERNRRNMINNYIDELRILVPANRDSPSTHYVRNDDSRPKHAVLSETIDCVLALRQSVAVAADKITEMRKEHEDEVNALKDQITLLNGVLKRQQSGQWK